MKPPFVAACEGRPDATLLPVDPRTLVVPGVNRPGAAVQFNAWWVELHAVSPPWKSTLAPNPTTCGEFRASVARGKSNIETRTYFQPFSTAAGYYFMYRLWGYPLRPANFDEQVIKRFGLGKAPFRNPYPMPWEDPNLTNGGSGQLPLGLVQEKDRNGRWTGNISSSCSGCHDSRFGEDEGAPFFWGRSSDAIGIVDLLPAIFDIESLSLVPSLLEYFPSHAGGMSRAPAWLHRAWKTRQFWDGALSSDNVRSEMAFGIANFTRTPAERRALTEEFDDNDNFFMSLAPPRYPKPINTALAETGAVLFHEKDLWASGGNADIPRAEGNGSCASCHGVYSPRYANDLAYLPDPRLKGVSGVITPIETIRTDDARVDLMADERKRRAWDTSFLAYNEQSPEQDGRYWEDPITSGLRRIPRAAYDRGQGPRFSPEGLNKWIPPFGYVAPPLYGAWANAPYFHNGSVPNLWGVLKPDARPAVWKRQYSAANALGTNAGYDGSYAAYDWDNLGWKYTALACGNTPTNDPFLPCSDLYATPDVAFANIANLVANQNSLAYQTPPPITQKQIRSRMIFNSYLYSQGIGGHDFTKTLTDPERRALIEYLKTL